MPQDVRRPVERDSRVAALEAELELYRAAFERMPYGLCMFDPDGRISLVNDRYREMLRLPRGSVHAGLSGSDVLQLCINAGHYPGQTLESVGAKIHSHLDSDAAPLGIMVRGDRSYEVRQARTSQGHLVTTCNDITAQLKAEGAARQSDVRLRAVLDAMPDCVKIFDATGELVHINTKGLELLEAPDIKSLTVEGYSPVPVQYIPAAIDVHSRVMDGESVVWSYELVSLKGTRRHVEAHSVPFVMPDGSSVHMSITRDITARHKAHDAIRGNEERLRLVQEATGLADFEASSEGKIRFSNQFTLQAGLPPGTTELTHDEWRQIVHPDDRERLARAIAESLATNASFGCEFRIIRPDNGEIRWISSRTKIDRDETGRAVRSVGAHLDITERKQVEEALRESEERFRLAAEAVGLGVWDYDVTEDRRDWSDRLREIFGIDRETEATLSLAESCIHPEDRPQFIRTLRDSRDNDVGRFEATFRIRRANDGAERWVTMNGWRTHRSGNQLRRIIMTVRDVTSEKTAEERVRWSASHDVLTGLANRSLFSEKLESAIAKANDSGHAVGLLMLDMDHFKQINDSLGHDAGDLLLKMFAKRLRGVVRHCDTVARLGGDEFAVVLPEIEGEHSLLAVARAIQERLREPFIHTGQILDSRVSIGASVYPDKGETAEDLLKNADMALYAAKAGGRGITKIFELELRAEAQQRHSMVERARQAIDHDRIMPYYQPKLDLVTRSLVGFEALLRWRTSRGRIDVPAALNAAFDDPEVASRISDRMIERVIADMRVWLDRGVQFEHVAVNASAAEFRRDNFAERLLEQLRSANIPTHCFQLEVTETVFLGRGAEYVHRALALLNMRGVKIALDDFGTGYASLRHLKQFPVDTIKIDQSFVRDMETDPGDEAIIRAVINLGHSLGIKVVAEGIESRSQARRLKELGCGFGQGYLFAKAVPASRVAGLIKRLTSDQSVETLAGHRALHLVSSRA